MNSDGRLFWNVTVVLKKCFIIIVNAGAADNKAVNSTIFHFNNKFNIHKTHMLLSSSLDES